MIPLFEETRMWTRGNSQSFRQQPVGDGTTMNQQFSQWQTINEPWIINQTGQPYPPTDHDLSLGGKTCTSMSTNLTPTCKKHGFLIDFPVKVKPLTRPSTCGNCCGQGLLSRKQTSILAAKGRNLWDSINKFGDIPPAIKEKTIENPVANRGFSVAMLIARVNYVGMSWENGVDFPKWQFFHAKTDDDSVDYGGSPMFRQKKTIWPRQFRLLEKPHHWNLRKYQEPNSFNSQGFVVPVVFEAPLWADGGPFFSSTGWPVATMTSIPCFDLKPKLAMTWGLLGYLPGPNTYLVSGLEHFLFFHIVGIIIPTDCFFQRVETTKQL